MLGLPHVVGALRRAARQPPPGLGRHVVDHRGDQAAVDLVEETRAVDAGMSRAYLLESAPAIGTSASSAKGK